MRSPRPDPAALAGLSALASTMTGVRLLAEPALAATWALPVGLDAGELWALAVAASLGTAAASAAAACRPRPRRQVAANDPPLSWPLFAPAISARQ